MRLKRALFVIVIALMILYELLAALDKRSMETCEQSNTPDYCAKHLRK